MLSTFYPNECFVCKSRSTLSRCGHCRLISYCGEDHQKQDWNDHKDFCSVIYKFIKKEKLSHIYEHFRGSSLQAWINKRFDLIFRIASLAGRNLKRHEVEMLHFPRSCIVCYDTTPDNLTNCPQCPLVSFCKNHPDTSEHDKICPDIKLCYDSEKKFNQSAPLYSMVILSIMSQMLNENSKLPESISDFLDHHPLICKSDPIIKIFASSFFCIPLTILSALQKINKISSSKVTIHFCGLYKKDVASNYWEILLHLLPNLKHLTIIVTEIDEASNTKLSVCQRCSAKKKRLIVKVVELGYPVYVSRDYYEVPTLLVFDNLIPRTQEDMRYPAWKAMMDIYPQLNCPMLLMADTEKGAKLLRDCLNSSFWKSLICFDGPNDFASMLLVRDWEQWEMAKIFQFMIIIKAPQSSNAKEMNSNNLDSKSTNKSIPINLKESFEQTDKIISTDCFYSGICHVCKSSCASVPCKRCKMIFYCGLKHAKQDWPEHKEICKAIVGLLKEKGTPHVFDNLEIANDESWMNAKFSIVEKIQKKLQRNLLHFEKMMFFFPRTCFVCHESDLSVLKTCECGISLCKIHRDDSRHKELCKDFILEMKIKIYETSQLTANVKVPSDQKGTTLPPSMDCFINSYLCLKNESSEPLSKILISEYLSQPLSLLYVLEKLRHSVSKKMVIHVIEATDNDIQNADYWKIILFWLNNLQSLKINFIGTIIHKEKISSRNLMNFDDLFSLKGKSFNFSAFRGSYDQFFRSREFSQPDLIVANNFDFANLNGVTYVRPWKKIFSVIKQLNTPFVLTGLTEIWARRESILLNVILERTNDFDIFEKNPYGSLVPRRDYLEKEGLGYSNNYIVVYRNLYGANEMKKASSTAKSSSSKKLKEDTSQVSLANKSEFETMKSKIQTKVENTKSEAKKQSDLVGKKETSLLGNNEVNVKKTDENSEGKVAVNLKTETILEENLLLQKENQILKENIHFREENEWLRKENSRLKEELKTLNAENI